MKYKINVLKEAADDLINYATVFNDYKDGLGVKFINNYKEAVLAISKFPLGYEVKWSIFRQYVFKDFKFVLIYEVIDKTIIIYKITSAIQNPKTKFPKKRIYKK